jgi:hypothetical protein
MPKNVIVVGMARSGTSLTASIFAKHGYYVDEQGSVAPSNHLNPKGYWESKSLVKLNAKILRSSGFPRDNTWIYKPITDEQVEFINHFELDDEFRGFLDGFNRKAPWIWKDPRLCYTLGCWWPLLDRDNTAVLLVRRDPEAIYNSFVRAGWRRHGSRERQATYERIDSHIRNAEAIFDKFAIPAVTIQYEDFKNNPLSVVDKINTSCDLSLSVDDLGYDDRFNHDKFSGKIGTYLDKGINRLPAKWIKRLKKFVPGFLLSLLYPERYEK